MSKPTHKIFTTETFEIDGKEKTRFYEVGSAWRIKDGGFSCQIRPNIAVTNRFVVFPAKEKK